MFIILQVFEIFPQIGCVLWISSSGGSNSSFDFKMFGYFKMLLSVWYLWFIKENFRLELLNLSKMNHEINFFVQLIV